MSLSQLNYRSNGLLSGQPLPLLSKSVEYVRAGERYAEVENWNLNGFLTGCTTGDLIYERNLLASGFSNCFGPLSIAGISFESVEIKSVSFPDSDYIGSLPFSIDFQCYTGFLGSGITGVIDPSDELDYKESRDGTLALSRSITAKGVNLGAVQGLDAAIDFVNYRLTVDPIAPFVITGARNLTFDDFHLISSEQNTDKLNGTVSAIQTYICDPSGQVGHKDVVNRYSRDIEQDLTSSTINVSVKGDISAGRYFTGTQASLLGYYTAFKSLYPSEFFTSESITDDRYTNKLNYSFSFPSGTGENFYENIAKIDDDFTITLKEGPSSSLVDVSVQGSVSSPFGCYEDRLVAVSGAAATGLHLDFANDLYEQFYTNGAKAKPNLVTLNPAPLSQDLSVNRFSAQASYSFSFNDRYVPSEMTQAAFFDSKVSVTLPTEVYFIKENYKGGIYIKQKANVTSREVINASCSIDQGTGDLITYTENLLEKLSSGTSGTYSQNGISNDDDQSRKYAYSEVKSYERGIAFEVN